MIVWYPASTLMGSEIEFYPESGTKFFTMNLRFTFVFERDAQGRVTGFVANGSYKAIKT